MTHRDSQMRTGKTIATALVLWALAAPLMSAAKSPGDVEIGQQVQEASLLGLNGKSRRLSEYLGKPLIINFWASWCGPCRAESASLERLAWSEAARKFTIIGISTDDDPRAAQEWLKASNATLSHFIDRNLEMENMLGANRLPLTVLVDAKGRVVDKIYGAKAWDAPEALRIVERAFGPLQAAPAR